MRTRPRTKKYISDYAIKISDNIKLLEPMGYLKTICLEDNAMGSLINSSVVQKEAYF